MLGQDTTYLGEEIRHQLRGIREGIGPARIVAGPMPMIVLDARSAKARTQRTDSVGVVEPDKPLAVGVMQGECVAQPVWSPGRRRHALDLEFQPITLFEMVDAAIEPERVLV
jgi:hypothetical protein